MCANDKVMKHLVTAFLLGLLVPAIWAESVPLVASERPAISRFSGKIAEGTKWETEYYVVDSGKKGATVLIVGGMHGNEPAGSRAAEQILNWPISSGKLLVIPRANVLALKANTRLTPDRPEAEGNLNRNFPKDDSEDEYRVAPRGELAAALWRFAFKARPDWVLDLHEGYEFHRSHKPPPGKKKSVGSSIIYRGGEKMDPLAVRVIAAADATVTNPDRRFSLLRKGPVDTGLARACINVMGAEGIILETTFKDQPISLRTRQHRAMVNVLLNHVGLIDRDCSNLIAAPGRSDELQVAVYDGAGTGASRSQLNTVINSAPGMTQYQIGAAEMRPDILSQFDVIAFPGGSGSKQAGAIGAEGREAIREYVNMGGGVIGVCAGAYLCSAHYEWSLDLIDSKVFTGSVEIPGKGKKQLWYRGKADIDIELSPEGEDLFGKKGIPKNFVVRYANGPIISPKGSDELEDYLVLAWFRSETGLWEPQKGTMINTPAIVSGNFGKGRIVSISPHPEATQALHPIITQSILWTADAAE